MQLWIYQSELPDGTLSFVLLFTDYDGINYRGVFIGQKDQNNRKECYWTLCTVAFAKTWTKQTIPNEQRRFWATHVNRNNLQSRFPSSLFVWEAKRKVSSPFPSADLRPFCEERTPHRRLQPEVSPFPFKYALTLRNRPLPSSEDPHFQNEARCTTFLVKMSFICMRMKNDFHIKGWAPTLVLKQRPGGTRKWAICIAKCLFPYRGELPENFGQTTAQEYKTTSSDWRASLKIAFG